MCVCVPLTAGTSRGQRGLWRSHSWSYMWLWAVQYGYWQPDSQFCKITMIFPWVKGERSPGQIHISLHSGTEVQTAYILMWARAEPCQHSQSHGPRKMPPCSVDALPSIQLVELMRCMQSWRTLSTQISEKWGRGGRREQGVEGEGGERRGEDREEIREDRWKRNPRKCKGCAHHCGTALTCVSGGISKSSTFPFKWIGLYTSDASSQWCSIAWNKSAPHLS